MKSDKIIFTAALALLTIAIIGCEKEEKKSPNCIAPSFDRKSPEKALPWPSDIFTTPDESSPTSIRLRINPDNPPPLDPLFSWYGENVIRDINSLDGFSTFAQLVVEIKGVVDENSLVIEPMATAENGSFVYLIDIDENSPNHGEATPVEVEFYKEVHQLYLKPIKPLRPKTRYGYLLTDQVKGVYPNCSRPSGATDDLVSGYRRGVKSSDRFTDGVYRLLDIATEDYDVSTSEVILAVSFTTQSIEEEMLAVRQAEIERAANEKIYLPESLEARPGNSGMALIVEGKWIEADYRNEDGVIEFDEDGKPLEPTRHELSFTLTIPYEQPERGILQPFPVVVYQHGMNNSHNAMFLPARTIGPEGYAFIGIDAVEHGERRGYADDDYLAFIKNFFKINFGEDGMRVEPRAARDNWRMMSIDHFQVVNLVEQLADDFLDVYNAGPDGPDGPDGVADLDAETLLFTGTSMGGISGGTTYSYESRFRNSFLNVPAAGLSNVVFYFTGVNLAEAVFNMIDPALDLRRFIGLYQMFLDRGDPINAVRRVFAEPFDGVAPRPLLLQMADDDGTLPNRTTGDMALAAGMPLLEPVSRFLPYLSRQSIPPDGISENINGATAGLFQFEFVSPFGGGVLEPANHGNVDRSDEGIRQAIRFFNSELDDGAAVIIDPYAE